MFAFFTVQLTFKCERIVNFHRKDREDSVKDRIFFTYDRILLFGYSYVFWNTILRHSPVGLYVHMLPNRKS